MGRGGPRRDGTPRRPLSWAAKELPFTWPWPSSRTMLPAPVERQRAEWPRNASPSAWLQGPGSAMKASPACAATA